MDDRAHTGGVQHHYMRGLCFDSMWDYQTRSRSGRRSWARLDMGSAAYPWAVEDDPEGAGWCVRCCASVLGQRPVSLTRMQKSPVPTGDPANVASALREILPTFEIDVQFGPGQELIHKVANTIGSGGGAIARLERQHELRQIPPCWVWLVGVEVKPASLCALNDQPVSMLLVGRELSPPWASGYGAKATFLDSGGWMVRSVDGHAWRAVLSSLVEIKPA
ncbi:hypothetical protein [Comamonas koreensis]|uniref:hypothetical protein n=1 Tax=Comamonas koreensis TaxID=160825 RepID=UPI0015FB8E24|nr:hypothetical protein [Comamonas koreensis]